MLYFDDVFIIADEKDQPTLQEFKSQLENGSDKSKIETMQRIIRVMHNGDYMPGLLMHIIRFVMPSKNKVLKKLLLIYWEICPKVQADGKLKQEMVLVCNNLRNDLLHPNEFIRGITLRFLCKLREAELVEPLVPTVKQCLEHKHPYVRRNAVLAVLTIYKNMQTLLPDAPELIQNFLLNETDHSCQKHALNMLVNCKPAYASSFFNSIKDKIVTFDCQLQLEVISLIKKDYSTNIGNRSDYLKTVMSLLHSPYPEVKYEAAGTFMVMTSHSKAVCEAAACYMELALKASDNNIKLIVLDRIDELREKYDKALDTLVIDILRILSSPDIEVRRKVLNIAIELVNTRNVEDAVMFLNKELLSNKTDEVDKSGEYRQLLIQAIHTCAIRFPQIATNVIHVLMEFVGDSSNTSAVDVISFTKEVTERMPVLRNDILSKLLSSLPVMKSGRVFRGALWTIGEYSESPQSIEDSFASIREVLGEVPILDSELKTRGETDENINPTSSKYVTVTKILSDGTYATESVLESKAAQKKNVTKYPLRALILNGDWFLSSVLSSSLTKLVLRYSDLVSDAKKVNALKSEAMLILTSIIRVGRSDIVSIKIDDDTYDRIMTCLRLLSNDNKNDDVVKETFLKEGRIVFPKLLKAKDDLQKQEDEQERKVKEQADDSIMFRYLFANSGHNDVVDEYQHDLVRATGSIDAAADLQSNLDRIVQLTGYSDPVYAEAYVTVHKFDILLDILIVNQTSETLQNLTVDLSVLGDLKVVERPIPYTIGPRGFHAVKASVKVSSTETGVIFSTINYDGYSAVAGGGVTLNEIHLETMDYIKPSTCSETEFRMMWSEFEWENKVNVNTSITDLHEYFQHILKCTNMKCLTPTNALSGECGFLAANLYARSVFGEDALANICLEQESDNVITGHIRIRSKTQGIALSLGDKITLTQG